MHSSYNSYQMYSSYNSYQMHSSYNSYQMQFSQVDFGLAEAVHIHLHATLINWLSPKNIATFFPNYIYTRCVKQTHVI